MACGFIPTIPRPVHISEFLLQDLRQTGVYFLYHRQALVYVGQTKTLKLRLDQHMADRRKVFDSVSFIPCGLNRLSEIEGHFIRKYAPKYNICGVAKKARMEHSWQPSPPAPHAPGEIKTVCATTVDMNLYEAAEFLMVPEADLREWRKQGLLPDFKLMTLLYFVPGHRRLIASAQRAAGIEA